MNWEYAMEPEQKETSKKRREERHKERQRQLKMAVSDHPVDWQKVESFMYTENLNPNWTEPGSRMSTAHLSAYDGEAEVLRWCLREKADVNARTALGRSALHFACDGNKPRCIRLLLEHGADVNLRTLSLMTPLHFCCQYNSYEAVVVLLHESRQVLDIDAENSKRQVAETLAKDRKIHRAIKKYRGNLDERRRADLMEQCLRRLFRLFDWDGNNAVFPEEWAETQCMIAQHFEDHSEDSIDEIFATADKNRDGLIDWEEFRAGHVEMLEALGIPFRDVLNKLSDIEASIFKERIRIEDEKANSQVTDCPSPVVSERAKLLARRRWGETLKNLRQQMGGDRWHDEADGESTSSSEDLQPAKPLEVA